MYSDRIRKNQSNLEKKDDEHNSPKNKLIDAAKNSSEIYTKFYKIDIDNKDSQGNTALYYTT